MKKILASLIFLLACALPVTASAATASQFTDIAPDSWYYPAVEYAASEGLFNGTSATTFSPNNSMTRGMFVTVLANKTTNFKAHQYAASSFKDVKAGQWYAPAVEWAYQNKLVDGVGNGNFAPNTTACREQLAVILYNYAKGCGIDISSTKGVLGAYTDNGMISSYARTAMEWAVTHGVMNGDNGKLNPKGTATRAQVAQIFYNCRDLFADTVLETPGKMWVVDVPGHYETIERLELQPVVVGEIGHWEDVWYTEWVYRCNNCGFVAPTVEAINQHMSDSIDWETMTGCGTYTMVSGEPIYTGEKYWVVDVPGRTELKMVTVTEQVWVDEVGHWE